MHGQYRMGYAIPYSYESNFLRSGFHAYLSLAGLKQVPAAQIMRLQKSMDYRIWEICKYYIAHDISPGAVEYDYGNDFAFQIFNQPFIMTGGGPMKLHLIYV